MNRFKKTLLGWFVLTLVLLSFPPLVWSAAPETTRITIMHMNDVHARVEEGIGYAKISTLIQHQRELNPNTLVLDAGDTFHGQTIATLVQGESIVRLLNELGIDAMVAGNHDFNYGLDRLLELAEMASFPILGANVIKDGKVVLQEHIIKEVGGVKIGIFGIATPETAYKTHPNNVKDVTFADIVATAQQQVDQLKDQTDLIIGLVHLGMDGSSIDTSTKIAEQVDGIDLIVDGHSHQEINTVINDTLIVQAGEYSNHLGIVEIEFADGKVVKKEGRILSAAETEQVEKDPHIQAVIDAIKEQQNEVLSEVVATTHVVLDGERETVRTKESNLGNLIADAMLWVTGADVAITNGGGIRASIDIGEITKGDIITVLPFGNFVVTLDVTGADIVAALQHGAGDYPDAKGAFPQVAGLSFAIDETKPKGEKVHSVFINGQPVEPDRIYTVATNDFLAAGGDEYLMFAKYEVTGHYPALDEILIDYLGTIGAVDAQAENRIVVQAVEVSQPEPIARENTAKENHQEQARKKEQVYQVYIVKPGDNLYRIGLKFGVDWQVLAQFNQLPNPRLIFPGQQILIPVIK